jgi:hypothetical protein
MRQLRDDTHLILDGEVRVYRRERSKRWQAAFVIDGHTIRISTGKRDLAEAKEYARDTYLEYKFRHKNDLPVVTKKFSDVAKLAIADMRKQLDAGLGRKVFADYIVCIERYLIPFFGAQYVTTIDYEKVQQFYEWRREKMGREPKASTLNTHNSAMNRVFEEAVARGFSRTRMCHCWPTVVRRANAVLTLPAKNTHTDPQAAQLDQCRQSRQAHRHAPPHAGLCVDHGQYGHAARHRGAEPTLEACDAV